MSAGWLRAIDEEMVSTHLGTAEPTDSYEDAKRKLNAVIAWHVAAATDPALQQTSPSLVDGFREGVEAAARLLDQKAEDYAMAFGYDDMGSLVFGRGVRGDVMMDHYTNLLELANEVRAMLAAAPKPEGE